MINKPEKIRPLVGDIKTLIAESKQHVAVTVNATTSMLYWNIGKRINEEILNFVRADYGEQIVQTLSAQLTSEYGIGFSKRNLFNIIRFAETFPKKEIVISLIRQLS